MIAKKSLVLISLVLGATPLIVWAQAHDASVANHQPHYYAAEDYDIDPASVTYADHIAPILQSSCQSCHRPGGGAPMSLLTYDQVKPWASVIMYRTAIRDRMGAMPPFFVEKDIGIDGFKSDYSLSDVELAM
ncbi:MAG: cytochrome c, partial [Gammaproteobacteria bacterium]|nr:cytochrome c [Gammaproteobacteria bacterium]